MRRKLSWWGDTILGISVSALNIYPAVGLEPAGGPARLRM